MISKDDFKNTNIFANLSDDMLEKIIPLAERVTFEQREFVFKEGDAVANFYIIKRGTILIEQKLTDKMTVTAGTITAGECFGYSSLFSEGLYSTNAVCSDQCEVLVMNGERVIDLLREDHSMGFFVMQNIVTVLNHRLDRRTDQFLKAVRTHPEIHDLEE